jgi:hypothetical protein
MTTESDYPTVDEAIADPGLVEKLIDKIMAQIPAGPPGPQGPPGAASPDEEWWRGDVWTADTRPAPQFSYVVGAWEYSFPDKETARKVRDKLMRMTLEGEL